ncbi:tRNA (adenosine(37)-N6)-dimethylallyltransferase MiaA [Thiomicrospira cyclica]|uniref:tRNA dimethylallyltransferase n=1 Tax=Thiomicrospira cyclica (strain DSM 14477 / JCM 11371 / ALM1) TaxID=717773 RepID=F6DBP7_THICA|nr:tRNA (adenosine(37)-N6)-dimethylallyltransferase MiaA [Thiomicrospira cyclica]AEG31283.1 tRNA dimethylallyltransferase [Thiomicrospira cyclica ALM1]
MPICDWNNFIKNPTAIAIMGPTASGKTALALALADYLPIEIINVDSVLIYRDLNIGAAKPTDAELAQVPHHLINFLGQNESYSVADFVTDAQRIAKEIFARGKIPVLVGGTMMYFNALTQGLSDLPSADPSVRARLQAEFEESPANLHAKLQAIDPQAAARINQADQQRLIRALEVYEISGHTLTSLQHSRSSAWTFPLVKLVLMPASRQALHEKIAQRLEGMFAAGLVAEVASLAQQPEHDPDSPAMRSVGYRQVLDHFAGEYPEALVFEKALVATRQLAKRQITWLRKEDEAAIFDPYSVSEDTLTQQVLEHLTLNCKNIA